MMRSAGRFRLRQLGERSLRKPGIVTPQRCARSCGGVSRGRCRTPRNGDHASATAAAIGTRRPYLVMAGRHYSIASELAFSPLPPMKACRIPWRAMNICAAPPHRCARHRRRRAGVALPSHERKRERVPFVGCEHQYRVYQGTHANVSPPSGVVAGEVRSCLQPVPAAQRRPRRRTAKQATTHSCFAGWPSADISGGGDLPR